MSHTYHPFIYIIIAASLSETASTITIKLYHTNALTFNIYSLIECLLWVWQFRLWGMGFKKAWTFYILNGLIICFWATEMIIKGVSQFVSLFPVFYSFILTFFAISQINQLIVEERGNLFRNAKFLICAGIIIFYPYDILVQSFYIFDLEQSHSFMSNVFYILVYVNLFVNLLYALATIWIPTRERFTLPYS